ncbi:hypothetical protein [Halorarum salinum]|uniref:MarR family transcriptional regulator n=1 Tax=Halorarum salinum TaxID=2743089 RepID=A0A7D5LBP6_9EURY|nr:hypothetical protein [Halobaculum salinum]QLG63066.1 hypothetical protein HUG12_15530 [Halobaculum salinum]
MNITDASQQIVRIVEMNTTEKQPDTAASHTILQIATGAGLSLPEANTALNHAVEQGTLVEENGRYRVA